MAIQAPISFSAGGANMIELTEGSLDYIYLKSRYVRYRSEDGTDQIQMSSNGITAFLIPYQSAAETYLGTSSYNWWRIYGEEIYLDGSALPDTLDDLYELSQMKTLTDKDTNEEIEYKKGLPRLDLLSLNKVFTNYDELREEIQNENGELISDEDFDEMLQDRNQLGYRLHANLGLLSNLTTGAVRQLDSEVIGMFELLSSRITALENKLNAKE